MPLPNYDAWLEPPDPPNPDCLECRHCLEDHDDWDEPCAVPGCHCDAFTEYTDEDAAWDEADRLYDQMRDDALIYG